MIDRTKVAILGAGMAGMAAARTLRDQDCTIFEARSHAGGHASSFLVEQGFLFDEGPHVSFTSNDRVKSFLARSVKNQFNELSTYATNYFEGATLKHPVQCNLHGLPAELIVQCIASFVRAQENNRQPPKTYKDWCYSGLGESISEIFTRRYTRKYWTLELEQMTTEWVSERIYAPRLEDVLRGALGGATDEHYYLTSFRYPMEHGFGGYTALLERDAVIQLGTRVVEIDLDAKKLIFANGRTEHYDHLISTMPLPEIVRICVDAPPRVREAAEKLACTSHFLLSIGLNRPSHTNASWTYYYDEDIPFSRASFPSMYSNNNVPPGCSSIQVEVVHSRYKSIPSRDGLIEQCLRSLMKVGLLSSLGEIVALDARDIQYANVIFDFDRTPNVAIVHNFLRSKGVHACGRFGDWAYLWTDQAMLSGERAANQIRHALGLESGIFGHRS